MLVGIQSINLPEGVSENSLITLLRGENLTVEDYKSSAESLLKISTPKAILEGMKKLLHDVPPEDKVKVIHNSGLLLNFLLSTETPPEAFKALIEHINAVKAEENEKIKPDAIVTSYQELLEMANKFAVSKDVVKQFESSHKQIASVMQAYSATVDNRKESLAKTVNAIDLENFVNVELKSGVTQNRMSEVAEAVAGSLQARNARDLLNLKISDLYKAEWDKPDRALTAQQLNVTASQISNMVSQDILKAKSISEQIAVSEFYYKVMQKSLQKNDYNTAFSIHSALSGTSVTRLKYLSTNLEKNKEIAEIAESANKIFELGNNMSNYRNKIKSEQSGVIPILPLLLKEIKAASEKSLIVAEKLNIEQSKLNSKSFSQIQNAQLSVLNDKAITSTVDLSRLNQPVIADKEMFEASYQALPKNIFDIDKLGKRDNNGVDQSPTFYTKATALYDVLGDDLNLPTFFQIKKGKRIYDNEKAYPYFLRLLQSTANEAIALQKSTILSPYEKSRLDAMLHKLRFVEQATRQHAQDNNASKRVFRQLDRLDNTLTQKSITKKTTIDIHTEAAKRHFRNSKAAKFREYMQKLPTQGKRELTRGPLNKNSYTRQYEELMKEILAGKSFAHQITKVDDKEEVIILLDSKRYNLSTIMKHVNLNHLTLNETDKQNYMNMLEKGGLKFPPCKPSSVVTNPPIAVTATEEIRQLDSSFVQNDSSLNQLSSAERLALNIYTTGFYSDSNSFLRGQISPQKIEDPNYLRELICTTGMAISGLNQISEQRSISTFRAEKINKLPVEILESRIAAAKTGGVTIESAFVSTAEMHASQFGFQDDVYDDSIGIVYKDLIGKDIHGLSAYPHEKEFLIPPTQVQWESHASAKGGHLFSAKPVRTVDGLSKEALSASIPEDSLTQPSNASLQSKGANTWTLAMPTVTWKNGVRPKVLGALHKQLLSELQTTPFLKAVPTNKPNSDDEKASVNPNKKKSP